MTDRRYSVFMDLGSGSGEHWIAYAASKGLARAMARNILEQWPKAARVGILDREREKWLWVKRREEDTA